MKSIVIAFSALALSGAALAQDQEIVKGNGNVVTRDAAVSSFNALKASGVYELKLAQGDKESVRIEADENLQDYVSVHNEGNQLVIDMKKMEHKDLKPTRKMRIYVTFKTLQEMRIATVGNVSSDEALSFDKLVLTNKSVGNIDLQLTANKLDLKNESVGNIKLSGKADQALVNSSGVGNIHAGGFVVQTMRIENTGVGNAEVNAEKDLQVFNSFVGSIRNKGAAQAQKIKRVKA